MRETSHKPHYHRSKVVFSLQSLKILEKVMVVLFFWLHYYQTWYHYWVILKVFVYVFLANGDHDRIILYTAPETVRHVWCFNWEHNFSKLNMVSFLNQSLSNLSCFLGLKSLLLRDILIHLAYRTTKTRF